MTIGSLVAGGLQLVGLLVISYVVRLVALAAWRGWLAHRADAAPAGGPRQAGGGGITCLRCCSRFGSRDARLVIDAPRGALLLACPRCGGFLRT